MNENHRTATCTTRYLYCVGFTLRVEITPDFGHGQEKSVVSFQCHENHHIFDGLESHPFIVMTWGWFIIVLTTLSSLLWL
jgi:hypothetical protein